MSTYVMNLHVYYVYFFRCYVVVMCNEYSAKTHNIICTTATLRGIEYLFSRIHLQSRIMYTLIQKWICLTELILTPPLTHILQCFIGVPCIISTITL